LSWSEDLIESLILNVVINSSSELVTHASDLLFEDHLDLFELVSLFNSSVLGLFVINLGLSEVGNKLSYGGNSLGVSVPGFSFLLLGNSKLDSQFLEISFSGSSVNDESSLFFSGGHLISGSSDGGSDFVVFKFFSTVGEGVFESQKHGSNLIEDGTGEVGDVNSGLE